MYLCQGLPPRVLRRRYPDCILSIRPLLLLLSQQTWCQTERQGTTLYCLVTIQAHLPVHRPAVVVPILIFFHILCRPGRISLVPRLQILEAPIVSFDFTLHTQVSAATRVVMSAQSGTLQGKISSQDRRPSQDQNFQCRSNSQIRNIYICLTWYHWRLKVILD